jgi:hypothetical protein
MREARNDPPDRNAGCKRRQPGPPPRQVGPLIRQMRPARRVVRSVELTPPGGPMSVVGLAAATIRGPEPRPDRDPPVCDRAIFEQRAERRSRPTAEAVCSRLTTDATVAPRLAAEQARKSRPARKGRAPGPSGLSSDPCHEDNAVVAAHVRASATERSRPRPWPTSGVPRLRRSRCLAASSCAPRIRQTQEPGACGRPASDLVDGSPRGPGTVLGTDEPQALVGRSTRLSLRPGKPEAQPIACASEHDQRSREGRRRDSRSPRLSSSRNDVDHLLWFGTDSGHVARAGGHPGPDARFRSVA